MRLLLTVLGLLGVAWPTLGCGGARAPTTLPKVTTLVPHTDAPYELADNADLEVIRDKYAATPLGSEPRRQLRLELATEFARRIDLELEAGERRSAYRSLKGLASLWTAEEISDPTAAQSLAPFNPQIAKIRDTFSRSGGDQEVVLALLMASVVEPEREAEFHAEINEVLAFGDELATAQYGEGAAHARPIEVLKSAALAFPAPYVTDRLVELLVTRQKALDSRFRNVGADLATIRAHGRSVLRAVWDVVGTYARAHRLADAPASVSKISGLGDDPAMRAVLSAALSPNAQVEAWVELASMFRARDGEAVDIVAGQKVCEEAIRRFPKAAMAHTCAGHYAYEGGRNRLAIRHFETGLALDATTTRAAKRLSGLYQLVVARLGLSDRAEEARRWLSRLEAFHNVRRKRGLEALRPGTPEAYAATARGLVSLGDLDSAHRFLHRSLELRPTSLAYELLGTIALRRDLYDEARRHLEDALALPVQATESAFDRNRVLRLLGEVHQGQGDEERASEAFRQAMAEWTQLQARAQLARSGLAEAEVERGKVLWHLGKRRQALQSFDRAIDADPNGASTHTEAVAFLVVRGEYDHALDACHRALGSAKIRDHYKVYMSLWMLAESRRRGASPDPLVQEFLSQRGGRLWYDELARYALGRGSLTGLEQRAHTRGKRAELYYYSAVLAERDTPAKTRRLLRQVLDTNTVLFFEYGMAKRYLASPGPQAPAASR